MKDRAICEMKYVVESIAIRISDIVGQRIANEYPVPLEIAPAAAPLVDADSKRPG